jgi:hypothetical protein
MSHNSPWHRLRGHPIIHLPSHRWEIHTSLALDRRNITWFIWVCIDGTSHSPQDPLSMGRPIAQTVRIWDVPQPPSALTKVISHHLSAFILMGNTFLTCIGSSDTLWPIWVCIDGTSHGPQDMLPWDVPWLTQYLTCGTSHSSCCFHSLYFLGASTIF